MHNLQKQSERKFPTRHDLFRFGSTATDVLAIGKIQAGGIFERVLRNAQGQWGGIREGSDKYSLVISHACHDYVRAADDGKRTRYEGRVW